MSTNEMIAKAHELKELKRMAEEIAAEIASIEKDLKDAMGDADQIIAGEYKIRWTKVTSNRFDSSAFKKEMPDLYARYTKQSESRRFSIN